MANSTIKKPLQAYNSSVNLPAISASGSTHITTGIAVFPAMVQIKDEINGYDISVTNWYMSNGVLKLVVHNTETVSRPEAAVKIYYVY